MTLRFASVREPGRVFAITFHGTVRTMAHGLTRTSERARARTTAASVKHIPATRAGESHSMNAARHTV